MGKANQKGRSRHGPPFVQLFRYMMETPAWAALKPQDRAVYIEVARLYDGRNNGYLALGVRDAAERANVNKDTAGKAFKRLADLGFLECAQPASFRTNDRKAAEWRLTTHKCDRTQQAGSRAFLKWRPENPKPSPKTGSRRSETRGQIVPFAPPSVPPFRTVA